VPGRTSNCHGLTTLAPSRVIDARDGLLRLLLRRRFSQVLVHCQLGCERRSVAPHREHDPSKATRECGPRDRVATSLLAAPTTCELVRGVTQRLCDRVAITVHDRLRRFM